MFGCLEKFPEVLKFCVISLIGIRGTKSKPFLITRGFEVQFSSIDLKCPAQKTKKKTDVGSIYDSLPA